MTILVDWQIRHAIETKYIGVSHYDPALINSNSLDLRLGSPILKYDKNEKTPIDPFDQDSIEAGLIECPIFEKFIFEPGESILATTLEVVILPADICAELNGKSSIARLFTDIHKTGGWIDCGFQGQITLEMTNCNQRPVILYKEMKIGQLVFHATAKADIPYGNRKGSKYQGQSGPTASRYHLNVEETNDESDSRDTTECKDGVHCNHQPSERFRPRQFLPGDQLPGRGKSNSIEGARGFQVRGGWDPTKPYHK